MVSVGFWERVVGKVQEKTKLLDIQYSTVLLEQEETIVDLLSFHCYPEAEVDPEIRTIKEELFKLYTDEIAPTVSRIEVYSHTLDSSLVEGIYNILQYISGAEVAADSSEAMQFYRYALSCAYFLKFQLQKTLSELLIERMKTYRRMVKDFNHRGVRVDGRPFVDIADERVQEAEKLYSVSRERLRDCVQEGEDNVAEIDMNNLVRDIGFDGVIRELNEAWELYKENLPQAIGNGYTRSSAYRIFIFLLNAASCWFLIYGFMKYFDVWPVVVDILSNL